MSNMIDTDHFWMAREEWAFQRGIEWFTKTYMPSDPEMAHGFAADLSMLVRQIYIDASRPANEQLLAVIRSLPVAPITWTKDPS